MLQGLQPPAQHGLTWVPELRAPHPGSEVCHRLGESRRAVVLAKPWPRDWKAGVDPPRSVLHSDAPYKLAP